MSESEGERKRVRQRSESCDSSSSRKEKLKPSFNVPRAANIILGLGSDVPPSFGFDINIGLTAFAKERKKNSSS